jgi:hypothetical protein
MFDDLTQALLDDFVEAGSDFYWKFRRQTAFYGVYPHIFPSSEVFKESVKRRG